MPTEEKSTELTYSRKSKPRTEKQMLEYATTPRGAYRIKKIYRAMKARK